MKNVYFYTCPILVWEMLKTWYSFGVGTIVMVGLGVDSWVIPEIHYTSQVGHLVPWKLHCVTLMFIGLLSGMWVSWLWVVIVEWVSNMVLSFQDRQSIKRSVERL